MSNIRFFITSNNLDLSRILLALGYNNSKIEINFNDYFNFLKVAYP